MNLKNKLIKLREKIEYNILENLGEIEKNSLSVELDDKVDEFICWYMDNMVKGRYIDIAEYRIQKDLRNFIEKMAVWYELRYPDYEVNRLIHYCEQTTSEIDVNRDKFYNTKAFISSLSGNEKNYLLKAKYNSYVNLYINNYKYKYISIDLTSNGFVKKISSSFIEPINGKFLDSNELIGKNIKEVITILKSKYDCTDEQLEDIRKEINDYENQKNFKEELLNCVMYRIIERGDTRIGSRRAFLFAQEFDRNIDIPMMYAVDYSDGRLKEFVNLYLKAGGRKDLICFTNYKCRSRKKEKLKTITIQELINNWNNMAKYTPEEDELHQRLVNTLAIQIDNEIVKKEEVKRLRLERKLEKSRINKY